MSKPAQDPIKTLPDKPDYSPGKLSPDDLDKIIQLRLQGNSYQFIADLFYVSKTAIINRLKGFNMPDPITVEAYKKNRADLLAYDQARYRKNITDEKLKKTPAVQLETMRCMAYDKERLERGQSTENVGYTVITGTLAELEERERRLKAEMGEVVEADAENSREGTTS
jgi:hypothetical protein